MLSLSEYADLLERSRNPNDRAVAKYIREHQARLVRWVREYANGSKEDAVQTAMLACVEAVQNGGAALKEVRNALERRAYGEKTWQRRKMPLNGNEDEVYASEKMTNG